MLKPAAVFQSGMLLQCDEAVNVWGCAEPFEMISVSIQGRISSSAADASGNWRVTLPALAASEGETMCIAGKTDCCELQDVAVGELWIAGGQSNMAFPMRYEKHVRQAKQTCTDRLVRFFDVPRISYDGQEKDFSYSQVGLWRKASAQDLEFFSAVGYYFEKELRDALRVPVGIIGCNWGGTSSSAWMRPESVEKAGPVWMEDFRKAVSSLDMARYRAEQKNDPLNDTGNIFSAFDEFFMPRTPSKEEVDAYFADVGGPSGYCPRLMPQTFPGSLYKYMLKTIAPMTVRGVLWYQGESDDRPQKNICYAEMLTALIADWRSLLEKPDLPFLIVQLPGFQDWLYQNAPNRYDIIRDCQERVTQTVPHTFLCSISDVGEQWDIHPKDKRTVGHRLALLARCHVYGQALLCDAPVLETAVRENRSLLLAFLHAEGGLKLCGERLEALHIFCDGQEIGFHAVLDDRTLRLEMEQAPPGKVQVCFAKTSWYRVNLFNRADIPAIPFERVL